MQEELSHSFDLADVAKYGSIEKALIIKEIRQMQAYKIRHGKEGWVYYSSYALEQKFPYMAAKSIQRWMRELIEAGHLEKTIQNKAKYDRTPSYRLPGAVAQNEPGVPQNEARSAQNRATIPPLSTPLSILTTNVVKGSPVHVSGQAPQQEIPSAQYAKSSFDESEAKNNSSHVVNESTNDDEELPPFSSEMDRAADLAHILVKYVKPGDETRTEHELPLSLQTWNRYAGAVRAGRKKFYVNTPAGGKATMWTWQIMGWEPVHKEDK